MAKQAKRHMGLEVPDTGIKFPSNAAGSTDPNTLDFYEEGSWTPALSGTSGGVYTAGSINSGRYTRIGNTVTVWCTVNWTAVVTPYTGLLIVKNLPFFNGSLRAAGSLCAPSGSSITQANATFGVLIDPNIDYLYIIANTVGGGFSHTPTVASAGTIFGICITYTI